MREEGSRDSHPETQRAQWGQRPAGGYGVPWVGQAGKVQERELTCALTRGPTWPPQHVALACPIGQAHCLPPAELSCPRLVEMGSQVHSGLPLPLSGECHQYHTALPWLGVEPGRCHICLCMSVYMVHELKLTHAQAQQTRHLAEPSLSSAHPAPKG